MNMIQRVSWAPDSCSAELIKEFSGYGTQNLQNTS